ncbi:MAG: LTA synthase family protein [Faecousia sp.]
MAHKEWKKAALLAGYWIFALLYWEGLLQQAVFGGFQRGAAYVVGFSVSAALVLALTVSFLTKGRFAANLILTLALTVLYGSEIVYNFIFGTLYSVKMVGQGTDAVTSFWRELLSTMGDRFPWLLALFVPLIALLLLKKFCGCIREPVSLPWRGALVLLAVMTFGATRYCLRLGGTEMFSNEYYYRSTEIATNQTAQRFGLLTAFRLELTRGGKETEQAYYIPEQTEPGQDDTEPVEVKYNVMDIDWDALNAMTEDKARLAINDYCSRLTGTNQNAYTGMLKDYNLIVLCAESFSPAAIHPELTPTLYRLSREGILFENYYNTFPNTTTDGEYALMQGLYPDTGRSKAVSSLYASRNSYLPFTLGNVFREQQGVESWGYHNYRGSYYGRDESHPNMGYTMRFADDGMKFTTTWPASDLEMMQQSVDDYIGQEQFHAYYMTFSGHYKYDISTNAIAKRNWDLVKDLPYSNTAKAYLSCNIELDKALEYLMQRLEEAGVADRTAIVIAGDHFPYGLSNEQYAELTGEEIDDFSKYKSSLIFWVGGLEQNIVVDEYCCNVDILPTILNLWGFTYDSRLLAGTDVFSDGTHVAVLIDKSWLTDKVWFNANTGEIRYQVPENQVRSDYIEAMNRLIATRFSISADILNSAYYNFVFDKGEVSVNRIGWNSKK